MMNESKVIPPVKELVYVDHISFAVNGKECGFFIDKKKFTFDGSNNSKILVYVSGFFKYYQNFPFHDSVICPLDGNYKSRELCKENSFPVDTAIVLQDPFEKNKNLTTQMETSAIQR